jgi:glycosyltransferase involved in cell wall biosynthesis
VNIALLTPGTGSYHCGVCMRDNALAKELIRQGHRALMLPMYLPMTLDEDAAPAAPIFFGGISTYLREKWRPFRHMPRWLDRMLSARWLLKMLAGKAAKTGGPEVAAMTISMLRGDEGNQAAEIEELIHWLRSAFDGAPPDAVWLSTALQAGLARRIRAELGVPVIGFLQGEDTFLDALSAPEVWPLLAGRMRDASAWVAPSRYFAELMARRLGWNAGEIRVVPNGVDIAAFQAPATSRQSPTIGYLARFVPGKGIGLLIEAFILLKKAMPEVRLRCAGSMTGDDARYVERLKARLRDAGCADSVEWHPNVTREEKAAFLAGITVFSVPATYSEAFGQYVIEALAAGAPVVLPRASAFPEIVESSGGGVLFELGATESESAGNLASALESLLRDPGRPFELGERGRAAVQRDYSMARLAGQLVSLTGALRS